jgi:hypothetical protein
VKVSYFSTDFGCEALRGSGATLGFQTAGGAEAQSFQVGFNAPVFGTAGSGAQSMSFHPAN